MYLLKNWYIIGTWDLAKMKIGSFILSPGIRMKKRLLFEKNGHIIRLRKAKCFGGLTPKI